MELELRPLFHSLEGSTVHCLLGIWGLDLTACYCGATTDVPCTLACDWLRGLLYTVYVYEELCGNSHSQYILIPFPISTIEAVQLRLSLLYYILNEILGACSHI